MTRERRVLAGNVHRALHLDYVDSQVQRKTVRVIVLSVEEYWTAAGQHRVGLVCRDLDTPERRVKTYLSQRIRGIIDPVTGEIAEDVPAFLAELLTEAGGQAPVSWPDEEPAVRRPRPARDGINGTMHVEGWAFGTIARDPPPDPSPWPTWTIGLSGSPPAYTFSVGAVFYQPPLLPDVGWAKQRLRRQYVLQVVDGDEDRVFVMISRYSWGEEVERLEGHLKLAELTAILHDGMPVEHHPGSGTLQKRPR